MLVLHLHMLGGHVAVANHFRVVYPAGVVANVLFGVRDMSVGNQICIMRSIIHACCVWIACSIDRCMQVIETIHMRDWWCEILCSSMTSQESRLVHACRKSREKTAVKCI
jgi:hypothetical protein